MKVIWFGAGFGDKKNAKGTIFELRKCFLKDLKDSNVFQIEVLNSKITNFEKLEIFLNEKIDKLIVIGVGPKSLPIFKELSKYNLPKNTFYIHPSHKFVEMDLYKNVKLDLVFTQEYEIQNNPGLTNFLKKQNTKVCGVLGVAHDLNLESLKEFGNLIQGWLQENTDIKNSEKGICLAIVGGKTSNGDISKKEVDELLKKAAEEKYENLVIILVPRGSQENYKYIKNQKLNELQKQYPSKNIVFMPFNTFEKNLKTSMNYSFNNKKFDAYIGGLGLILNSSGKILTHTDSTTLMSELLVLGLNNVEFVFSQNTEKCNKNFAEKIPKTSYINTALKQAEEIYKLVVLHP